MSKNILVTGGAGFIGSHLLDKLTDEKNHKVTILDNLDEQIHRIQKTPPEYLNKKVNIIFDSTTNYDSFKQIVLNKINPKLPPLLTQQYRIGDIRHCVADISKIKKTLGFQPKIRFSEGIDDLLIWIRPQIKNRIDKTEDAIDQLEKKKLIR